MAEAEAALRSSQPTLMKNKKWFAVALRPARRNTIGSTGGTTLADDTGSSQSGDLQSEAELDMVAETPLDALPEQDPAESAMQIETANVSPIEGDSATADGIEAVLPQAAEGGARPKSYLDSVAEVTVQNPIAPMEPEGEQVTNPDAQRKLNNPEVTTTGRGVASRARPYGPWIIVTRADRRLAGRSPRQIVSTGPNKGNQNATGSRFAPLEGNDNSESVQGDGTDTVPVMDEEETEHLGTGHERQNNEKEHDLEHYTTGSDQERVLEQVEMNCW
nr:hypothetical protein Iba_chr13dCG8010 [Ipomoea batatas]